MINDSNYNNATGWNSVRDESGFVRSNVLQKSVANITWDDATWILTSSFIIFTMQSGFGLLESGSVNSRNEVNIMVKNAIDVLFGGLTFWMFGFGLSFGEDPKYSNRFCGWGYFFLDANEEEMGWRFSWFVFHMSFATTSTTIVSGAMAERARLTAYIIFSTFNTFIYCFPAHWIWAVNGFLYELGAVDVGGAAVVHMGGGVIGLIVTIMLGPRAGKFDDKKINNLPMGCPTNVLLGMFMLWWGWLGFNTGSTFGISDGKWKLAARSAVNTVLSSSAGGCVGTIISVIIGAIGACLALTAMEILPRLRIDDPVSVIPIHLVCGIWSMMSVGIFADEDKILNLSRGRKGLLYGGGFYLLGVQLLSVVIVFTWTAVASFIELKLIDSCVSLRLSAEEEELGNDIVEHGINHTGINIHTCVNVKSSSRKKEYLMNKKKSFLVQIRKFGPLRRRPKFIVRKAPLAISEYGLTEVRIDNSESDTRLTEEGQPLTF